jgi:hypothetical protein
MLTYEEFCNAYNRTVKRACRAKQILPLCLPILQASQLQSPKNTMYTAACASKCSMQNPCMPKSKAEILFDAQVCPFAPINAVPSEQ